MTKKLSELKQRPAGEKKNPEYVKYGTKDGQIEFGHLHLGSSGDLQSDVTSGVMLQAYNSLHYMSMDIDGVREGWTLNRSPGPNTTICATNNAGVVGSDSGIGYLLIAEHGDIVIRAPKGRIRLSALDIDIRADGSDNTRGSINLDSNQSINLKTGTFDVQSSSGVRIFSPKSINLVANTSLKFTSNFINGLSAASATLANKAYPISTKDFLDTSEYSDY